MTVVGGLQICLACNVRKGGRKGDREGGEGGREGGKESRADARGMQREEKVIPI